eukprot:3956802-Amphidinium_carterae.1
MNHRRPIYLGKHSRVNINMIGLEEQQPSGALQASFGYLSICLCLSVLRYLEHRNTCWYGQLRQSLILMPESVSSICTSAGKNAQMLPQLAWATRSQFKTALEAFTCR